MIFHSVAFQIRLGLTKQYQSLFYYIILGNRIGP